jgi:hypothetical protein
MLAECSISGQTVSCQLGDIAQGNTTTIRLKAQAAALPDAVASLAVVNTVTATCSNDASCRAAAEAALTVRHQLR